MLSLGRVDLDGAAVWFSGREGGVSRSPYDALNLADHVGDDAADVAENRRRLARAIARDADVPDDPREWVWLRQVHGATVVRADSADVSGVEADGVVTTVSGLPLVILAADCVPVALASPGAVGAVHAGWKGLEAGVIAGAVAALDTAPDATGRAWLAPCIHPCHYAFGPGDLGRLASRFGDLVRSRTLDGHLALDLPAAVRHALHQAGVDAVTSSDDCTAHEPQRWFSHRRDGVTGRQAMVVVKTR